MRRFVIFFSGKEGTSPLVRLLDRFDDISIVHQIGNSGWEPFDAHNCGSMSVRSLERCLDTIFGEDPIDMRQLNELYTRTSSKPLEQINDAKAVGFKMRFRYPKQWDVDTFTVRPWMNKWASRLRNQLFRVFKSRMVQILKRNNVYVCLAVRQDVLRWALSKYHGDGTGKHGHLQFKMANGHVRKSDLPKLVVDCDRLDDIITSCEKSLTHKRDLYNSLNNAGVKVRPILYEDFLKDKRMYLKNMFRFLDVKIEIDAIERAIEKGEYFRKVHSEEIADFVINHDEVFHRFGSRSFSWP